jgi:hypothetical protein
VQSPPDPSLEEFCREIEVYLCRRNDGHLIRIVGPAFDTVVGWAADGIPFKVACEGIDRYCQRGDRKGPRRRPVRIEFCEADVLDVFDEWRRATGLPPAERPEPVPSAQRRQSRDCVAEPSADPLSAEPDTSTLAAHIDKLVARLTMLRGRAEWAGPAGDRLEATVRELDRMRAAARKTDEGDRRAARIRLQELDRALLDAARGAVGPDVLASIERDARQQLASYRERMADDVYARSVAAAVDHALRQRAGLPRVIHKE